jgi:hypothetical protein
MPPALWQSALVLAAVTSAASVGAVKATAMPRATIADTSFFIDTSPPFVGLPSGSAFTLGVQRASGAEAKRRCGKNAHRFARLSIAAVLCPHRDGSLGVSNLLLRRRPSHGEAPPQAGLLLGGKLEAPDEQKRKQDERYRGVCDGKKNRSNNTSAARTGLGTGIKRPLNRNKKAS